MRWFRPRPVPAWRRRARCAARTTGGPARRPPVRAPPRCARRARDRPAAGRRAGPWRRRATRAGPRTAPRRTSGSGSAQRRAPGRHRGLRRQPGQQQQRAGAGDGGLARVGDQRVEQRFGVGGAGAPGVQRDARNAAVVCRPPGNQPSTACAAQAAVLSAWHWVQAFGVPSLSDRSGRGTRML